MKEFKIHFDEKEIENLKKRIDSSRLPIISSNEWNLGTNTEELKKIIDYWRNEYDWYNKENELNKYPQFTCEINDSTIHFFHIRSSKSNAMPLLLTHGWPDSFLRYMKTIPLLTDFNLVIPSLPGFAFSTLPKKGYTNNSEVAESWHKLMTEVLGYKEYIASGGDMGRGVTCYLATYYPNEVKGIHLTDVGMITDIISKADEELSADELVYKQKANEWLKYESAYINIQSTKPQSLAYLLSDSPIGMAAWIIEKYHAWSDWERLKMDDICDCLTLYWLTNTAGTSIRAYHGNTFTLPKLNKIQVPTAISSFPHDVLPMPRTWVEKNYPVVMYNETKYGGHFAALESPEEFSENILRFINEIVRTNTRNQKDVEDLEK